MIADPVTIIETALHAAGKNVKRRGDNLNAQCPAHDDGSPSLSVAPGTQGRDVLLYCHAGCKADDILVALNLQWTDFGEPRDTIEHTWQYHDEHGTLAYEVVRKPGKKFLQRRPVGNDWEWNLKGVERLIYRLPAVIIAVGRSEPIWITEGEKDADRLVAEGVCATCNSGGAGKFTSSMADLLRGAVSVTIVADRDQTGADHAAEVAKLLDDRDIPNRVVQAAEGKDAADHFAFGHDIDDFVEVHEDGWPDPLPLTPTGSVMPFPVDVLPQWIRQHVQQVADELQAPVDLPAQLSITALSLLFSKRYKVHVKSTWFEPLCTYLATALDPTVGKSPAVAKVLGPIKKYERYLIESSTGERDDRSTIRKVIQKEYEKAINAGNTTDAYTIAAELRDKPEIHEPRLIADDVTPEKLAILMERQGGRLAIVSTEGDLFNMMAGKYKDTSDLAIYLKSWSADDHVTDRVNRETVVLTEAHLTIGITVQPAVLRRVARNEEMRELGLSARFMFSIPPDHVGYRDLSRPTTWDERVAENYGERIIECARLAAATNGDVHTLKMSAEAAGLFTTFRQDMETRRRRDGDLETLRAWSGKMESTVARIAGLFHLADFKDADTEIDWDTVRRAITIGFYWITHAKIVEGLWAADPTLIMADTLVDWIERKKLSEFTLRDAYRSNKAMFPAARDAVDPLEILTERGWIRTDSDLAASVGVRGVESPRLTVHPRLSSFRNNHGTHGTHGPKESNQELPTYLYPLAPHGVGDMRAMSAMTPGPSEPTATTERDPDPDDLDQF